MKASKSWTIVPCTIMFGVTPAHATTGGFHAIPLLGWLFIVFGCLIVVAQLIPGIMLFAAMLKGVLTSRRESREMQPLDRNLR